jgi:hypothetical protein
MGVVLMDTLHGMQARLALSATAIALAACGAAISPVSVATHPAGQRSAPEAPASGHTRAASELASLLAGVQVPPEAERVSTAPVTMLADAPVSEASPNLLTLASWWRLDMSFSTALAWIQAHPPRGLRSNMAGTSGGPGVPVNRSLGFSAPSTTAYDGASVELDLAAMGSAETGLRADAEVIWLPAKPSTEFVPAGTAVTLVAQSHFGQSDVTTLRSRHLDTADAAVMIGDLNALLPSDGGAHGCAADIDGYRVQIEAAVVGTALVFSDWPACVEVSVTRGGVPLLTLTPTTIFQNEVTRLIGFPPLP